MVLKRSKTPETLFHKQIIFMTFIGAPEIRRKDRIVENDCFFLEKFILSIKIRLYCFLLYSGQSLR